jgi:hypothetical protein
LVLDGRWLAAIDFLSLWPVTVFDPSFFVRERNRMYERKGARSIQYFWCN